MSQSRKKHNFSAEILRAYDIRGKYEINLNAIDGYFLGRSIAKLMADENLDRTICIGRDARLSSPALHAELIEGLIESGCKIIDIGVVATPTLYYSTVVHGTTAGIMITGSHNPGDQNGFKIMYGGRSFYGDRIQRLGQIAADGKFVNGSGEHIIQDIRPEYVSELMKRATKECPKNIKIAWDSGNGATGELVEMLAKHIPGEHVLLHTKLDGNFPNHHPDPTIPENMQDLIKAVKENGCDVGFAFDGDGDRLGAVDSNGRMIAGDQLLLILAKDLLQRQKGFNVVADVKTSDSILNIIDDLGAKSVMWKTGHSLIKEKMIEVQSPLAGEMSGHLFFGEDYFGFDDALFGACKMVNILSNSNSTIAEMVDGMPQLFSTPELRVEVDEEKKFTIVDDIKKELNSNNVDVDTLDGIRVKQENGWYLVRASNTQNSLVVRVEGNTVSDLKSLCDVVIDLFSKVGINGDVITDSIKHYA